MSTKNFLSHKALRILAAIILISFSAVLTTSKTLAAEEKNQSENQPIRDNRASFESSDIALPEDFFERMDLATIRQNFMLAFAQLEDSEYFRCTDNDTWKTISFKDETDTGEYYFLFELRENGDGHWSPNGKYSFYTTDYRISGDTVIMNGKTYFHRLMFTYFSDSLSVFARYIGSQEPVPEEFIMRMYFCADAFKGVTASDDMHEVLDTDVQTAPQ